MVFERPSSGEYWGIWEKPLAELPKVREMVNMRKSEKATTSLRKQNSKAWWQNQEKQAVRHHEVGGAVSKLESLISCIQLLTLPLLSQADVQSHRVIPMRSLISSEELQLKPKLRRPISIHCSYNRRRTTHVGATYLSSGLIEMGVQLGTRWGKNLARRLEVAWGCAVFLENGLFSLVIAMWEMEGSGNVPKINIEEMRDQFKYTLLLAPSNKSLGWNLYLGL